jgi:glycosyltransferase involved in cell wall biosynthesis
VDEAFRRLPHVPRHLGQCSMDDPLRLLYVSTVDMYKHQWHVVEAVANLRAQGYPVALEMVGGAYPPALRRLREAIARADPAGRFVTYVGAVPHDELPSRYHRADAFVFASTCENMPNILLEAMAAGLPIACARSGPMPDILGDAGTYFAPEKPATIADAIVTLASAPDTVAAMAARAAERARLYSWRRCATETLGFLADVGRAVPGARC